MMKLLASLLTGFIALLLFYAPVLADDAPTEPRMMRCGAGNILINELDYDQPSNDEAEFIELKGTGNHQITALELHLVNGSGNVYAQIDLSGETLSYAGFLTIGGSADGVQPDIELTPNSVLNTRAGVGLFDTQAGEYCNFINYEGTVPTFEGWLNIGEDTFADGAGRGCARRTTGWWNCNKITTPNGANGTVAITLDTLAIESPSADQMWFNIPILIALILLCILTATVYRLHRSLGRQYETVL